MILKNGKRNKEKILKSSSFFPYRERKVLKGWKIVTIRERQPLVISGAENSHYEIMKRKTERLLRMYDEMDRYSGIFIWWRRF